MIVICSKSAKSLAPAVKVTDVVAFRSLCVCVADGVVARRRTGRVWPGVVGGGAREQADVVLVIWGVWCRE